MQNFRKVRIFVASPGDMSDERDRLIDVVNEFNRSGSPVESLGLVVEILDWRTHLTPFMGRPEGAVLQQLPVESWDIFVGIIWLRFGTPTGGFDPQTKIPYESGTEEEFRIAYNSWQSTGRPKILFYRCNRPPDRLDDLNPAHFAKVKSFLEEFEHDGEHSGLIQEFSDATEFERRVRQDLTRLLDQFSVDGVTIPKKQLTTRIIKHSEVRTRYLEYIIAAHQFLPVAGFETSLRIPIPLDEVYVTLKARMPELEHVQKKMEPSAEPRMEEQFYKALTVQEALKYALESKYSGLVILGNPGSGKTTLIKYLLYCFATDNADKKLGLYQRLLPVLLNLREVNPQKSLLENILTSLQKYPLGLDAEFFLPILREGEVFLLLDGLDEVATDENRHQICQWIQDQVHLSFPRCPIIITSRFSGYRGSSVLTDFYLRLEIQDYEKSQIKQFIVNWLTAVETHLHNDSAYWRNQARIAADDLINRIESNSALRELAVNPLMLQIINLVHHERGSLPQRRVELYKECTDVMLERWDRSKGLEVPLTALEARQLLQPVALWMHSVENRNEVNKEELIEYIKPILPRIKHGVDPVNLLRSWQERGSIFKGENDRYFFHHLSFQEYLVAEEIRNERKVEILAKNFDQPWWREPTLLAMGLTNPPIFQDFMEVLLQATPRDGASVDFMLRCIDEALVKKEEPFTKVIKNTDDFEARYWALLALEKIGSPEAKTVIRSVLQDKNLRIAELAQSILARFGETPAKKDLETIKVLIKNKRHDLPARIFNPLEFNSEYILIPGGRFNYSVTQKNIDVSPFYLAKYPVTNKLYARFITYLQNKSLKELQINLTFDEFQESLFSKIQEVDGFTEYLGNDPNQWAVKFRTVYGSDKRFGSYDQPVIGVSWYAATAYCHWLTLVEQILNRYNANQDDAQMIYRLPTEVEWEFAATGGERRYPWGNEQPNERRANFNENVGHTTPVAAYPEGATPEGIMDMAGNAWEWMENLHGNSVWANARALRSGSWRRDDRSLRCTARFSYLPHLWHVDYFGFRVLCTKS